MKISQVILVILALAIAVFGLRGLAPVSGVKQGDDESGAVARTGGSAYDRVIKSGVLRCAYALYPPFMDKDPNTGKLSGIMPDIMADFEKANDIKVQWGPEIGWGELAVTLQSGKADAICSGMVITPKRGKVIAPSLPLYWVTMDAYVKPGDARFDNNPARMNRKDVRIAVNMGDFSEEMAMRMFSEAQRVYVGSMGGESQLFMDVATGKADVTFSGPSDLSQWNSSNGSMRLRKIVLSRPLMAFASVIGVDIHEHELLKLIDSTLRNLTDNGLLEKAVKANTGADYGVAYFAPKPAL